MFNPYCPGMTNLEIKDRRVRRTRMAIFDAFRDLVLSRRYDDIRIADITSKADIGRSTFYDNFKSKDDVLLTSIEPLFSILVDVAAGQARDEEVHFVLGHFWEQRAFARIILQGTIFEKLTRKLAEMIEARRTDSSHIQAIGMAASQLWVIRTWLEGKQAVSLDEVAALLREQAPALPV